MFSRLHSLIRAVRKRSSVESDMSDEICFHLQVRTEDLVRSGLSKDEARRQATLEFGAIEGYKEQCRESLGLRFVDELLADSRHSLRTLRKRPLFAIVAVLTLGLGIGGNTAMFSVLYAAYFQPIPVLEPFSLYQVTGKAVSGNLDWLSYPEYLELKTRNQVFSDVFADYAVRPATARGNLRGYLVTGNYFTSLGVHTVLGRSILPDDDGPAAEPVLVLGKAAWQSRFAADPGIVGNHIDVAGRPFTVVGVAGPEFSGLEEGFADFWTPLSNASTLTGKGSSNGVPSDLGIRVIGRLRPGITPVQAQSSIALVLPDITAARQKEMRLEEAVLKSRATYNVWDWNPIVTRNVILGFIPSVLVLLIVCANLANIQLARGLSRNREIGIRLSLGAGRSRVVRQLVTESVPIALTGAILGLTVAHSSLALIRRIILSSGGTIFAELDLRLDWQILGFALLLSAVAVILFGLVPALNTTRPAIVSALKTGAVISPDASATRLRDALVVAQFALSMTLLIAASGIFRNASNSASVSSGCDTAHTLGGLVSQDASIVQVGRTLAEMPGVTSVARGTRGPLGVGGRLQRVPVSAGPDFSGQLMTDYNFVSTEYFDTLGIPIARGRAFTHQETDSDPSVAIVSQSTAQRFWPGEDPVGRQLRIATWMDRPSAPRTVEVVGVAGDVTYWRPLEGKDGSFIYLPTNPRDQGTSLLLRVEGDPAQMALGIQSEVSTRFPRAGLELNPMEGYRSRAMLAGRISTSVTGATGLLGLLLASIGMYGVIAYLVNRRILELGIRMALGAESRDLIWLILRDAVRLMTMSAGLGLLLGLALSRILAASIFKINAADPLIFVGPAAILAVLGLLASYLPARRATRVEPGAALRYE